MKKNITVNIGGIIFHIDEDAYDRLETYLESIQQHFQYMEGSDEVLADIENRIAEMLQTKITDEHQVVTLVNVIEVIEAMGQPADFEDEIPGAAGKDHQAFEGPRPKRLFRDPDNKMIGGICSGLANYFHIDLRLTRLLFVIVTLLGFGIGVVVYLILWVFVPQALTTAEKLEMRGEKVTISNIEKSIREEFGQVKDRISGLKEEAQQAYGKHIDQGKNIFEKILDVCLAIVSMAFKVFVIFIGLIFITVGVFLIMGILLSFADTPHVFSHAFGLSTFSIPAFLRLLLDPKDQSLAIVGLCLVVGIPLIMLVYTGARLIFRFKSPSRFVGIPAFSLLIAGLVICGIMAVEALQGFSHKGINQDLYNLKQPKTSILYIDVPDNDSISTINNCSNKIILGNWNMISTGDTSLYFGVPSLEFIKTESDSFQVAVYKIARGENRDLAKAAGRKIKYHYLQNDSSLLLSPYFYIPEGEKYRAQSLKLVIKVPANKTIQLSNKMAIFFDNNFHESLVDMSGKRWRMADSGLKEVVTGKAPARADSLNH
jgi:phage shock protein PspC (stress-responsive transcriptional regulator)